MNLIGKLPIILALTISCIGYAKPLSSKNVKLIKMSVTTKTPEQKAYKGTSIDQRRQMIKSRLKLTNQNKYSIDGVKVELFLIGKNMQEKKYFTILKSGKTSTSLKSKEKKSVLTVDVTVKVDKKGYKYGYDYDGYIAIMKNSSGKIIQTRSNRAKFTRLISKLKSFKNKEFTKDGVTRRQQFSYYIDDE